MIDKGYMGLLSFQDTLIWNMKITVKKHQNTFCVQESDQ